MWFLSHGFSSVGSRALQPPRVLKRKWTTSQIFSGASGDWLNGLRGVCSVRACRFCNFLWNQKGCLISYLCLQHIRALFQPQALRSKYVLLRCCHRSWGVFVCGVLFPSSGELANRPKRLPFWDEAKHPLYFEGEAVVCSPSYLKGFDPCPHVFRIYLWDGLHGEVAGPDAKIAGCLGGAENDFPTSRVFSFLLQPGYFIQRAGISTSFSSFRRRFCFSLLTSWTKNRTSSSIWSILHWIEQGPISATSEDFFKLSRLQTRGIP